MIGKNGGRAALRAVSVVAFAAVCAGTAAAGDRLFDELRFGVEGAATGDESGLFYQMTMFLDPFDNAAASGWKEELLRPRMFIGGTLAGRNREASMVFGGLSWDAKLTEKLFVEAGFGGAVHDGTLKDDGTRGPALGCRALFREYAAVGYDVTAKWRVLGQIEHSSHASLCDGPNDGLTRAGIAVGYRF